MTRAEEYREHAKAAEEQANRIQDCWAKENIARRWRELAEQVERHEGGHLV
jgi:hypothetical protein